MTVKPTIADALAGARYGGAVAVETKSVLVAGAAGRLGERVLARVLGASEYSRIYVLASDAMRSTEAKLTALTQDEWTDHVDHVIAVVGEAGPLAVSIERMRTEVFLPLPPDQVLPLARQAKAQGASRFMLVTPTDVLSQPGALYAQFSNLMETELHQLGFESLIIVRPSDHELRQRYGSFAARFVATLIDTARGLMVGLKHTPLSLEDTARAVVRAMLDSTQGLNIIETDRLHRLLKS